MSQNEPLLERLANTANKLRHMWGNNPDSDNIEEAIKALTPEAVVTPDEAPAPSTTKRQAKG